MAAGPEDDGTVVRGPADRRIDAVNGPGLLQITIQAVIDRRLATRLEVLHIEDRLVANAADEGERPTVRRGRRPDRAAGAGDEFADLAGLAIEALDHIDLAVRVLAVVEGLAGCGVITEVEVTAVRREGRFAGILLLGATLGQLHALATRAVVHPHLAGPERAARGEMLSTHDKLAVRRPVGLVQQTEALVADLGRVRPVAVHHPDVVAAAAVRGEGDLTAVRRIFGLHVPGDAAGDDPGLAARDRHHIDVAQQVEDDFTSVGTDVQRHPGAFGDVQRNIARRSGRSLDVPFGLVLIVRRHGVDGRSRLRDRRGLRRGLGQNRRGECQHRYSRQQGTFHQPTPGFPTSSEADV